MGRLANRGANYLTSQYVQQLAEEMMEDRVRCGTANVDPQKLRAKVAVVHVSARNDGI
ncbi:hypothetical protein [Bradyrhizobium cenepequi]|uniref:hypothetical protein n=1 Tax=Bradyrhizobium cenepequi TaxID=2821403 RepID=UPI001CE3926D|nr:hypothetical protein [Bradyrhizobium cenepequi]MCA6108420.1 hypothetical protein [Bradyrhizobium cenepequi]